MSSRTSNGSSESARKIYFLQSLSFVHLAPELLLKVPVLHVAANGKTRPCNLRISKDKFTVYIQFPTKSSGFFGGWGSTGNNGNGVQLGTNWGNNSENRAIDIGEIDRVQRGQSTQQFEKAKKVIVKAELNRNSSTGSSSGASNASVSTTSHLDPQRSFSIIFRGAHTYDLMALTVEMRKLICDALDRILQAYQLSKGHVANDVLLLRYVWLDVDQQKTGYINYNQIQKVFSQINWFMKPKDCRESYEKFGKVSGLDKAKRSRGLTFEQSASFLHYVRRNTWMVKPITVIWNELFGEIMNNGKIRETVSEKTFLDKFLLGPQGESNSTILDVRKLFRRLHDMEISHNTSEKVPLDRITKDQFEAFLLAASNDAFDPHSEKFHEANMHRPISEYWINTSHNTYLIGDQYKSHSSVEMYSNALYRGCRCLELDIWDGPKSSAGTPIPVVWHGHTMTTKILFVEIIKTIRVFLNFHPDTYPIILSFENHCSLPYQRVMAIQLHRILGDSLYVPTEASLYGPLPSPAQLRGMVVIKGRRPDGTEAEAYDTDDESDDENPLSIISDASQEAAKKVKSHGVAPELARLTLFHGFKLLSFNASIRTPTHHMHSFSENKVRSQCKQKHTHKWIIFNQSHMSRTYPAGSRVDSSNYNPLLAWSTGCQMVALNFQTPDPFLRLNDGRFRENGNCGYVLKPMSLMMDPAIARDSLRAERLVIRVLSGSCLPKPKGQRSGDIIDPYVKVSVFDVKNEEKESITTFPTGIVQANGFFPIWTQDRFIFNIEDPAAAMVQLTVLDKTKDEFIASASIPYYCLRKGIRSVKLYDVTNTRSGPFDFATLLLEIKKTEQLVAEI